MFLDVSPNEKPKTVIMMGIQGAGKGTQTELLKTYLNSEKNRKLVHVETGNRFREILKKDDYISKRINEMQQKGMLQPVFLPIYIWSSEFVSEINEDCNILIDGFPRRIIEAEVLNSAFLFFQRENIHVFNLKLSEQEAINRLQKRGREDDNEEAIKNRIETYKANTEPILNFFKGNNIYNIIEIDADRPIEDIHQEILTHLK